MSESASPQQPPAPSPASGGEYEPISASRCARGYVAAPPAPFCPCCAGAMVPFQIAPFGTVLSYTILFSPPAGFSAPLSIALVELPGGVKFICHGHADDRRGLRVGRHVRIEHADDFYYFAAMSTAERARLLWSRRGETSQKLRAILRLPFRRRR